MKRNLWRIIGVVSLVMLLGIAVSTVASAQTNPHTATSGFTTTTDACAGCHRLHTGTAAYILKSSSQYNLCVSCHDGSGADNDVVTGQYSATGSQGVQNGDLKAGGFEAARLDHDADGVTETGNITSKHTVGGTNMISWGSGTSGNGETVSLVCASCHNPHGNGNYRNLRPKPTSLSAYSGLNAENITAGLSDNYTQEYTTGNYTNFTAVYTLAVLDNIGDWCNQCHTRYSAGINSATTDTGSGNTSANDAWIAGASPNLYRHQTETLTAECLACHVAHGTNAVMSGASSGNITYPSENTSQAWQTGGESGGYSRLLRVDNRGICIVSTCHTGSSLSNN